MYRLPCIRTFILIFLILVVPEEAHCDSSNPIDSIKIQELFQSIDSIYFSNPPLAIERFEEIISIAEGKRSLLRHKSNALIQKAYILEIGGSLDKSMEDYQEALKIAQDSDFSDLAHRAIHGMAYIKDAWGNSTEAIEDIHTLINMTRNSDDSLLLSSLLNDLGILLNVHNNPKEALPYLFESLKIDRKLNDIHSQAIVMNNLGNSYTKLGDYDKALTHYFKSLELLKGKDLKFGMRENYSDIGKVHELKGNWEIAVNYYLDALRLSEELELEGKVSQELLNLSGVYYNYGDYSTSIAKAKQALVLQHEDSPLKRKIKAYDLLSKNYESLSNFKRAIHFRNEFLIYKDSLEDSEKASRRMELEMRFQTERQEAENIQLKLQQTENELVIKRRNILALIIGAGFLIALGLLLFFTIQNKQKKSYNTQLEEEVYQRTQELETALSELERFTYIASHDLKEPLRNISGFVSLIDRNIEKNRPEKNKDYIQYVKKNTKQLYDLIQDILNYSTLNQSVAENRRLTVANMVTQYSEEHSLAINEKRVDISCKDETGISLPSTFYIAIKNIISNGIKYNDKAFPKVKVHVTQQQKSIIIQIADNGIGIDSKYYKKIFKMFTRLHVREQYDGSGLGLAISKKVIDHFEGDIVVQSTIGKGTEFKITLPVKDEWRKAQNEKASNQLESSYIS